MTDIDTSAEAVERVAVSLTQSFPDAEHGGVDQAVGMGEHGVDALVLLDAAATLRALLRERDEARAARSEAIREMCEQARAAGSWKGIADGKDIIIRQLEAQRDAAWQAGAEAMRDICAKTASERGAWASNDMDAKSLVDRLEANGRMEMAGEVFEAIRALPIPERPV